MRHSLTIIETASTIASQTLITTILYKKELKSQEPLSPLEQANAEKLLKLESERLASEQEFLKYKEQESKKLNLIFELI